MRASFPDIPTPIPVMLRHKSPQVSQTGHPRPGFGAQLKAVAEEMAGQGQHLLWRCPDPGGPEHFAPSPPNTARPKSLTSFIGRCSSATVIPDKAQSSIVLEGILCKVKQ